MKTADREQQIKTIAYDIWAKEGCPEGCDVDHWLRAKTILARRLQGESIKKALLLLVTAILIGLFLLYEWISESFQISHGIIMAIFFVLVVSFVYVATFRDLWESAIDFLGLENTGILEVQIGGYGGILTSIYLLLSGANNAIPPALQFSIVPITATLGGLVIAGANYSRISQERRSELLRVAQNLIVATIAFMFFAIMFSLSNIGGTVDPNRLPSDSLEWAKLVFFWVAVALYFSGASMFVIGILKLAIGLRRLKGEPS